MRDRSIRAILAMLVLLVTGCVEQVTEGDTSIFRYATWIPLSMLLAALALVLVGWFLRKRVREIGWPFVIVGLILLLITPSDLKNRVTVNPQRFTLHTGPWFAPTRHDVPFDDIQRMELVQVDPAPRKSRNLLCRRKSGDVETIMVHELMRYGGLEQILETARKRGIPIQDNTQK